MNVEITGRHVVITPAIRSYVLRRVRKFSRILEDEASFHVIIGVEKNRHTAEVLLKSKMLNLTCKGQTDDMYASILLTIEKLERQALKQKAKVIETKRQKAKAKSVAERSVAEAPPARAGRDGRIVEEEARKKPMAVEEAVLELGQSEYPFVVFRDVDSGAMHVLYKRKDGSLGLIH
jgi:putative sigma-54 modulation protein